MRGIDDHQNVWAFVSKIVFGDNIVKLKDSSMSNALDQARNFLGGEYLLFSDVDKLWRRLKKDGERAVLERLRVHQCLLDELPSVKGTHLVRTGRSATPEGGCGGADQAAVREVGVGGLDLPETEVFIEIGDAIAECFSKGGEG